MRKAMTSPVSCLISLLYTWDEAWGGQFQRPSIHFAGLIIQLPQRDSL